MKVLPITPAQFITQHILRVTAKDLAAILHVDASAVGRYHSFPEHHRKTVDRLAWKNRKIRIKPEWHERVPFEDGVPSE